MNKYCSSRNKLIKLDVFQAPGYLDDIWNRYPGILSTVLGYLDNKSLAKCRQVNKTWKNCIDSDKIIWRRIITQISYESKSDSWKQILHKIPLHYVLAHIPSKNHVLSFFWPKVEFWSYLNPGKKNF